MDYAAMPLVRSGTIPFTDLIRAGISSQPLSMPVSGSGFTRLQHVTGIPSLRSDEGYSLTRLQALDALIARIRGSRDDSEELTMARDSLEEQQQLLEEMSLRIVRDMGHDNPLLGLSQGLIVDMTA
jgi:hypothetical protein